MLVCNYCYWSSASVGISGTQAEIFEAVRSRHLAGREAKVVSSLSSNNTTSHSLSLSRSVQINSLTEFYQKQYSEASRSVTCSPIPPTHTPV